MDLFYKTGPWVSEKSNLSKLDLGKKERTPSVNVEASGLTLG